MIKTGQTVPVLVSARPRYEDSRFVVDDEDIVTHARDKLMEKLKAVSEDG